MVHIIELSGPLTVNQFRGFENVGFAWSPGASKTLSDPHIPYPRAQRPHVPATFAPRWLTSQRVALVGA